MEPKPQLSVNPDWASILSENGFNITPKSKAAENRTLKCHLVVSLIIYLSLSLREFIPFLFESDIQCVKTLAGNFMSYYPGALRAVPFTPARVYSLWHSRWPQSRAHLHSTIVTPCVEQIVLSESNAIISNPDFKFPTSTCTVKMLDVALKPGEFSRKYQSLAPFLWRLLLHFTTSPNRWRKQRSSNTHTAEAEASAEEDDADGCSSRAEFLGEEGEEWRTQGFLRNPIFTLVLAISMMAFTRNSATNLFPLLLGLFLEISGTSARVISTLTSSGACVSVATIERLKEVLSKDARDYASQLLSSKLPFFVIFDNINLYLRKAQQRIFNQNSMIHATNAAVIGINGASSAAFDLSAHRALRGKRAEASGYDILPTHADDAAMQSSFAGLVICLITSYCPGSKTWEDREKILAAAESLFTKDRPLPPEVTDVRPMGVFDINEGSKKGVVSLLTCFQEFSQVARDVWASAIRIFQGDWLTSNNLRGARRDRVDDIDAMEQLDYIAEISALWHFALNATHMLIRTHLGVAMLDPGSLAKHKGLLNRNWDPLKPNYADAKALIRHSLIARILYSVMIRKGFKRWAELSQWEPSPTELQESSHWLVNEFATAESARKAKAANDDFLAHSIFFIRDALIFCEFERAVSTADAGPVLRVLKYWACAFRGASLHNYGRECVEVLVRWQYELTTETKKALEKAWFVNRWGQPGRWIPADLYNEQLNFWVKRVFIAKGSGLTVDYIKRKGSAPVEAFRKISHTFSRAFGFADRARRSKEIDVIEDLRILVEHLLKERLHIIINDRPVYAEVKVSSKSRTHSDCHCCHQFVHWIVSY